MHSARVYGPAVLACLFLLFLSGCLPGGSLAALVYLEQRHLYLPDPPKLPAVPIPPMPPPPTVSNPETTLAKKEFSLDEAIKVSLANSNVVRVLTGLTASASGQTIYDPAIANTAIDDARSVFDPVFSNSNTWNHFETPQGIFDPTSPAGARILGTATGENDWVMDLTKKTITGGTFKLEAVSRFQRFKLDPALAAALPGGGFALNPQDQSNVSLSFTQPLLKGAGIAPNVAPIVIARLQTEVSYFQFKDSMQEMVRGVAEAYWSVVFARTDAWAKRQQVEQSEFAYKLAEARLRVGLKDGTAGALAQAEVALSNFKASLVGAEANVLQREAALRNLLGLPPTMPDQLVLTTPENKERVDPRWEEIVKLAEERRPDLIELKLILEADEQARIIANNQARPQVDATTFYRWNGLEGIAPSGARLSTGPGQFTDWTLGVNFSVPLGLRQSRAALRKAELVIVRDRANLDQGLHSAVHTLAGNMRNIAQYYEQYQAYKIMREAARINLDQQTADFKSGRTIYLNVLQAITDWGNAVSSEAATLALYNTELANLERQTGTILETHGIRFFEERYRSVGPLGRIGGPRNYPLALPPGPNSFRYPVGTEPAEKALEREAPVNPLREPRLEPGPGNEELPAPRPRLLPPMS